jgi:hypothetical protein
LEEHEKELEMEKELEKQKKIIEERKKQKEREKEEKKVFGEDVDCIIIFFWNLNIYILLFL